MTRSSKLDPKPLLLLLHLKSQELLETTSYFDGISLGLLFIPLKLTVFS